MSKKSFITKTALAGIALAVSTAVAPATIFNYTASLDGPSESPANASPATGFGTASYDNVARTLTLNISFSGLTGTTTASHIHGPTVNPFTGTAGVVLTPGNLPSFPLGVTSGSYSQVLDLSLASSYPTAFITANGGTTLGAENAIMSAMAAGKTYWNIHSTTFAGGEIRGFLTAVPEPTALALFGLGASALLARRKLCR